MSKVRRIDYSPDEFLAGTIILSDAECGLYWRLCSLIYSHGEAVAWDELRRVSPSHGNAFNAMMRRLLALGKVIDKDGKLTVKRCETELENAEKRSRSASENVAKRWGSDVEIGVDLAENNNLEKPPVLQGGNANHQPSTINHHIEGIGEGDRTETLPERPKPKTHSSSSPRGDGVIDLEFEVFWREVPRRIGKGQAVRAYKAARKKVGADIILIGIKLYAEHRRGEDERYTKHPATWLNGECWSDEQRRPSPKVQGFGNPGFA